LPAHLYLEEFQPAVDLLSTAAREAPGDRVIEVLLMSAKEGLIKSKKQEEEVWGGAMKKQLHHDPEPVIAQEQSLSKAIVAGIILSFAILGIAVLLGGHY
jgi:hypothetical protein